MRYKNPPKFRAVYVNHKDYTIGKGFASEETMTKWLEKHAKTVKSSGPCGER